MSRRFGPKQADHPGIGAICQACSKPIKEFDYTALISLGPGDNPKEQAKALAGRPYTAVAIEIHWDCSGLVEPVPDRLTESTP